MKVAVSCSSSDPEAPMAMNFGRCPGFLFADTVAGKHEFKVNRGLSAPGGAGVAAAQQIINEGVATLITGRLGPNAFALLQEANIALFQGQGGSAREEVEKLENEQLTPITTHGEAHPSQHRHGRLGD